jgi:hypothetical protein
MSVKLQINKAEPLIPGPSHLNVETGIANIKKYKVSGSDQILGELIQEGETLVSAIRKLINSIWSMDE